MAIRWQSMIVAMADVGNQSSLGVLGQAVGVEADVDRALAVLSVRRTLEPGPELRNAIAVALMHSSYLYENEASFPGITRGLLNALSTLGFAFLRRMAAADAYQQPTAPTAGSLSTDVAEIMFALPTWAAKQAWLLECAALGRTFADAAPPASVSGHLLRRVVAVLCLAGEEAVASLLLQGLVSDVRRQRATTVADPKTALQEAIAPITPEYSYERVGPDHETVFHCTVTAMRGRRGSGAGRSKKLAAQNAALDFLQRHIPQAPTGRNREQTLRPNPVAIPEPRAHAVAVRELQDLFFLPLSATPLLSQALVHASWAYEHRPEIAKYRQQDNQVLSFVGAETAGYEDAFAATRHAVADPPQEFAFRGFDNEGYNNLFRRTGLASNAT